MITNQEAIDCIKAIHVQMFNDGNTKWTEACDMAIKALHGEPDGEWIEQDGWDGDPYYDCPICGQSYSGDFGDPEELGWHYCPECGAHLIGIKRRETDDEPEEVEGESESDATTIETEQEDIE